MQSIKPILIVLVAAVLSCGVCGRVGHAASSAHGSSSDHAALPALSERAVVGREIFFDERLSSSGKLSCASCHSAANAYGPPNALSVQLGGRWLHTAGLRAVPSLRYTLARTPIWAHPDRQAWRNGSRKMTTSRPAASRGMDASIRCMSRRRFRCWRPRRWRRVKSGWYGRLNKGRMQAVPRGVWAG